MDQRTAVEHLHKELQWQLEEGIVAMLRTEAILEDEQITTRLYKNFKNTVEAGVKSKHELVAACDLLAEAVAAYLIDDRFWGGHS